MYFYRCTEQQLNDALQQISEAGDKLLQAVYKGGRDWVLICRKDGPRRATLDDLLDELYDIKVAIRDADSANSKDVKDGVNAAAASGHRRSQS